MKMLVPKTGNWIYWYSFNYGGIHVIQMSTEHNWTRGSEQYKWLEHDLEQVDRNVTPWVVLTAHRMMVRHVGSNFGGLSANSRFTFQYTSQVDIEPDMNVSFKFQEEVEDLIYQHRVNVMLVRAFAAVEINVALSIFMSRWAMSIPTNVPVLCIARSV